MHVLIIGGTGLTGTNIVRMLVDRGYDVTIFHRGTHPLNLPGEYLQKVQELIGDRTNPQDMARLKELKVDFLVDMMMKTEREAKEVVEIFQGRLKHAVHISSADVYRVFGVILGHETTCLQTCPIKEEDDLRIKLYPYDTDYDKIPAEKVLLEGRAGGVYPVTILRYPGIFGPGLETGRMREWFIVKRILDGRFEVPLPEGGHIYFHHGFTENLAHAVVLTIENYQTAGPVYNTGDEEVFSLRQLFHLAAEVFNVEFKIYSIPYDKYSETIENNPYALNNHILLDLTKLKNELGYRQLISAREAFIKTFLWLKDNPRSDGYELTPDYEKEAVLIEWAKNSLK